MTSGSGSSLVEVADLVLEIGKVARVDYNTDNRALRDGFQARLDKVLAEANARGISFSYHRMLDEHTRGTFVKTVKPGDTEFARALFERLDTDEFGIREK